MSIFTISMSMPNPVEVQNRKQKLERLVPRLERKLAEAPEGSLMTSAGVKDNSTGLYHVVKSDPGEKGTYKKVYLSQEKKQEIRALAQKEYYLKALRIVRREVRALEAVLRYCEMPKLEDVLGQVHEAKRPYIRPIVETDEAFRERWLGQKYQQNEYEPEQKIYTTERGDLVRSKSEGQQADYLYYHDYAYLYEKRLELKDGGRTVYRYPDFTILDPVTRKEVFFEHFGMADEEGYLSKNAEKLRLYMENGYVIGRDVIFTLETRDHPFTLDQFAQVLEARFGPSEPRLK